jgi:hypothetical protein
MPGCPSPCSSPGWAARCRWVRTCRSLLSGWLPGRFPGQPRRRAQPRDARRQQERAVMTPWMWQSFTNSLPPPRCQRQTLRGSDCDGVDVTINRMHPTTHDSSESSDGLVGQAAIRALMLVMRTSWRAGRCTRGLTGALITPSRAPVGDRLGPLWPRALRAGAFPLRFRMSPTPTRPRTHEPTQKPLRDSSASATTTPRPPAGSRSAPFRRHRPRG